MKIVHIPHPVLTVPVKKVTKFDKKLHKIINEMIVALDSAKDPEGVGLAANQVGLSLALFVIRPDKKSPVTICINPKIVAKSPIKVKKSKDSEHLEGCLSIPEIWGRVDRAKKITLKYQDIEGNHIEKTFTGFDSIIIQHEMDHLEGVLFTQRVLEQKHILYKEVDGEFEEYKI